MNGDFLLSRLKYDDPSSVRVDQDTDWVLKILEELSEEVDLDNDSRYVKIKNPAFLNFRGTATRKNIPKFGDVLLLEGDLKARFLTNCVLSGRPMMDDLDTEVAAAFILDHLKEELGYEDEVSLYIDESEYDLYFYQGKKVDIKPVLHEYVFLNKNPYPKLKPEGMPE